MDKHQKLSRVVAKLQQLTEFLKLYLPLANVHNTNFIVSRHWDTMIPEEIGLELLQLDDNELSLLPSGGLYYHESAHGPDNSYNCGTINSCTFTNAVEENAEHGLKPDLLTTCDPNPEYNSDDITHREELVTTDCDLITIPDGKCNQSDKETDRYNVPTVCHQTECSMISDCISELNQSLVPEWQHQSLREFIVAAVSCTLPQLGLLTSLAELSSMLALPSSHTQPHIVVSHAMKVKKSYEVDVMSKLCAWIAKGFNVSNVSSYTTYTEWTNTDQATQ